MNTTIKSLLTAICLLTSFATQSFAQDNKSIDVELLNAHRTITYKGALIVDGQDITLSDKELTATEGNEIAVLVVNGGHLTLNNCTIRKTGDGISQQSNGRRSGGQRPEGNRGDKRPDGASNGQRPDDEKGQRPEGQRRQRPDGGNGQRPGGGGGGGGDDSFSFYGLNSAVVVLGKDSRIDMNGCTVETNANYANAVFACDGGTIDITNGIRIRTEKGGSRGLFATCAGIIKAEGVVDIETKGAHCAALATDRGGGTVVVGHAGTKSLSRLMTGGEGSPCIYSTGDISAYNAEGDAAVSQTMVVEGRNSINIEDCHFTGKSPQHGGIMLYQSTSGDAREGTSVLTMKDCTIRDNSATTMILVTNTHSIVNMDNCRFLNADGKSYGKDDAFVACRNCNGDGRGHHWGREGSNGGQVELNLTNQTLTGTIQAAEEDSRITITADKKSNIRKLTQLEGKGQISLP